MGQVLQLKALVKHANNLGHYAPVHVTKGMVEGIYDALNRSVFSGALTRPKIVVRDYSKKQFWGECEGWQRGSRWGEHYTKVIRIERNFPNLKKLIQVVAHEMVHQWEWEYHGVMTHGEKTFLCWKEDLKYYGIRLDIIL